MANTENNNIEALVIYKTNEKIANWYKNVLIDYGVDGQGICRIEGNEIFVDYTENGEEKVWSMAYYPEYVEDNGLEYFYNVWAEQAR